MLLLVLWTNSCTITHGETNTKGKMTVVSVAYFRGLRASEMLV